MKMLCEIKQNKDSQNSSQDRPDSQKRTREQFFPRDQSSSSTTTFSKQNNQINSNQKIRQQQQQQQNNNFETGITLDEYFGTNFKSVSKKFIIKEKEFENNSFSGSLGWKKFDSSQQLELQNNNNTSRFLDNMQINETDEDQYTESNCISNKMSRQIESRMKELHDLNAQQCLPVLNDQTKLQIKSSQKVPKGKPSKLTINTMQFETDFDNHIALRNANFQIYRSSQYGQSFLQIAQNLDNHSNNHRDYLRKISLEKQQQQQQKQCNNNNNCNNNGSSFLQSGNTKLFSSNYSQLNQNLYATNYQSWAKSKKQLKQKSYFEPSSQRSQKSLNEKFQMKKLREKENTQLLLKYAEKFNFNLDECRDIFGNDLKGKALYDKLIGLNHSKNRQNNLNLFNNSHIKI